MRDDPDLWVDAIIAHAGGKKRLSREEIDRLMGGMDLAVAAYWFARQDSQARRVWAELADLVPRVIDIIKRNQFFDNVIGADRRGRLLRDLEAVRRARPPQLSQASRSRGRPKRNDDLRALCEALVATWVDLTGAEPRQDFEKGMPLSHTAQFVCSVVKVIAPDRLGSVPKALEAVVTERRKASGKYRPRRTSRNSTN